MWYKYFSKILLFYTVSCSLACSRTPTQPKTPLIAKNHGQLQSIATSSLLSKGKTLYKSYCLRCHGDKGIGRLGPNLTDSYWIYGNGQPQSIGNLLIIGATGKGMPAWGSLFTQEQLDSVTLYIYQLQGISQDRPKAPKGTKQTRGAKIKIQQ